MTLLLKEIYGFNVTSIKIFMPFFTDVEKELKFTKDHKATRIAKSILGERNTAGGIAMPDIKLYCRTIVIKTARYQHKPDMYINE